MTDSHLYLVACLTDALPDWHRQRLVCMAQFMLALVGSRTVNLERIAQDFITSAEQASVSQRLRRFLNECAFAVVEIPIVILRFLPSTPWVLTLDRTEWKFGKTPLNILVLGVILGDISVPLVWHILPKAGCSSTAERLAIFDCFFVLAPPERIAYLTADREFVGEEWFAFLLAAKIDFRIRIRKNFTVHNRKGALIHVCRLFAALPIHHAMSVAKPLLIDGHRLWIHGMRLTNGDFLIVLTPHHTRTALQDYAQRWTIEVLFGCLKSRGFNCEDTHLTKPERIQTLLAVLALTFLWAYRIGQWKHAKRPIPIKKHGRKAKSIFRYGLDELAHTITYFYTNNDLFISFLEFLYGT